MIRKYNEFINEGYPTNGKQPKTVKATNSNIRKLINNAIKKYGLNANLNFIDTSDVSNMSDLFSANLSEYDIDIRKFNGDISEWDVSNVVDMSYMFDGCEKFNSPLKKWDVSGVEYMCGMFRDCISFNQSLNI